MNPKQSENNQVHQVFRPDVSALSEKPIYAVYECALQRGVRPLLLLLGMMQNSSAPEIRAGMLDKNNPDSQLLQDAEDLWKSLGYPKTELWQRLLVWCPEEDLGCAYEQSKQITH